MSIFDKVKYYYDKGIYKIAHVKAIVAANKLTKTQYKEITGEKYSA